MFLVSFFIRLHHGLAESLLFVGHRFEADLRRSIILLQLNLTVIDSIDLTRDRQLGQGMDTFSSKQGVHQVVHTWALKLAVLTHCGLAHGLWSDLSRWELVSASRCRLSWREESLDVVMLDHGTPVSGLLGRIHTGQLYKRVLHFVAKVAKVLTVTTSVGLRGHLFLVLGASKSIIFRLCFLRNVKR